MSLGPYARCVGLLAILAWATAAAAQSFKFTECQGRNYYGDDDTGTSNPVRRAVQFLRVKH